MMGKQSLAEYVRGVLLTYPEISPASPEMCIDWLGSKPTRYSIDAEPTTQVVKRYNDGETLRRVSVSLLGRFDVFADDVRTANAQFYEGLSLWLEHQTRFRLLPPMWEGATPRKLLATGGAYLETMDESGDSAAYRMQIEFTYYQKEKSPYEIE